jgi:uncharacterized protein
VSGSAVYEGWVTHRRLTPVSHSFRYRIFLPLFDLAELPELLDPIPLWSARRLAPARFDPVDFLDGSFPLSGAARDLVLARVGRRPAGPVRVLANPRYLGVGFNPISFLFCHDEDENGVEAVIAEVTNTPWRERITYVLDGGARDQSGRIHGEFEKEMHVSPFQPMHQRYVITVGEPGECLRIRVANLEEGREVFSAKMVLHRQELTPARMLGLLMRYPPATIATLARIYGNAARLKVRRAPFHPHPRHAAT